MAKSALTPDEALAIIDPELLEVFGVEGFRAFVSRGERPLGDPTAVQRVLDRHHVAGWVADRSGQEAADLERAARRVRLDKTLDDVSSAFREVSIDFRILKGMATSELDYSSPHLRDMVDIDLLVRPKDHAAAVQTLVTRGFDEIAVDRIDPLLLKGRTLRSPIGVEVDLHTRLNKYTSRPIDGLFERGTTPLVSGLALSSEDRMFHAATHLLLTAPGHRTCSSLIDVLQIAAAHTIDSRRLWFAAEQFGQAGILEASLEIISSSTGHPLPLDGPRQPLTRLERSAHLRSTRLIALEHLHALMAHDSVCERLRYAAAYVLPSRQSLQHRGGTVMYVKKAANRAPS